MSFVAPAWAISNPAVIAYRSLIDELRSVRYLRPYLAKLPQGGYYLAGSGKASVGMAQSVVNAWGPPISGLIVTKTGHREPIKRVEVIESSHPVPDESSLAAGKRLQEFAQSIPIGSKVIYLLSGGSSSLVELLPDDISLDTFRQETQDRLRNGATIEEINTYRKSVSLAKGGKMAEWFAGADLKVLVLSDVIGDDLSVVGSSPLFPHFPHKVVANNELAIKILTQSLETQGLRVVIGPPLAGDMAELAIRYVALIRTFPPGTALIGGGEGTVKVRGNGQGGRCQHFALQAAISLRDATNIAVLAGSTDGTDGPTDVAAAVVNSQLASQSAQTYLDNGDSFHFLQNADGLIYTGPTQSNINDVVVAVHS